MRRVWLVLLVALALVGIWLLVRPPGALHPKVQRGAKHGLTARPGQARQGTGLQGKPSGSRQGKATGKGSLPSGPSQPANPPSPAEHGGVVAPIYAFFADIQAAKPEAAYQEMAASWRESHSYASFLARLPKEAPILTGVVVTSVGDFTARADVFLRQGSQNFVVADVLLVNEAGPPGAGPTGAVWRLAGLPLP